MYTFVTNFIYYHPHRMNLETKSSQTCNPGDSCLLQNCVITSLSLSVLQYMLLCAKSPSSPVVTRSRGDPEGVTTETCRTETRH